ncbi:MAG: hypothetical protein H7144_11750 [Burkholderiales bacterium]|nr:hypothetical protein [Phycisphaerae bacterium]
MPRYLGVTFPAVAIIVAALIARQPARWMQIVTLLLFVVVNMSEFGARVVGHTEPPVDRMARDVIDAQPRSVVAANAAIPTFRAYTFLGTAQGPDPGKGTLFTGPGSYYLRLYAGIPSEPRTVRIGQYHGRLNIWPFDGVDRIARDLERSPQIERFVVWSATIDHNLRPTDLLAERLKGKFRRVSEEYIPAYDHWTWRKTFTLVRREYVLVK